MSLDQHAVTGYRPVGGGHLLDSPPKGLPRPSIGDLLRVCQRYKRVFGHYPNLRAPSRFTEKIQWRKLFDLNPVFAVFCDKLAVRDFIATRVGASYLPELLWVGEPFDDIPFNALQPPYILKCNRSSGGNVIVTQPGSIDLKETRETLQKATARTYGRKLFEPGYFPVRPHLLAERLLLQSDGTPPIEHKMFVFDGRVRVIHAVVVAPDRQRYDAPHDVDWNRLGWHAVNKPHDHPVPRPARLDDLIAVAERLGAGLDHVRVDLYDWDGGIKVGELTPYNMSGMVRFVPDETDFIMGSYWHIGDPLKRALASRF